MSAFPSAGFLHGEENFLPTPCRKFFHAMRLEGCKRKLPQWHTDYADATDDHRFLFRSMLIAHLSPLVMSPNRKNFRSDALKYS